MVQTGRYPLGMDERPMDPELDAVIAERHHRRPGVVGIKVRPEARLFFEDYPAAVVVAPPDGLEPPTATTLDWYAEAV